MGRLLAGNGGKGADPALALQRQQALVKAPAEHHVAVEFEKQFLWHGRFEGLVHSALGVQDGQTFEFFFDRQCLARHLGSPLRAPCQGGMAMPPAVIFRLLTDGPAVHPQVPVQRINVYG